VPAIWYQLLIVDRQRGAKMRPSQTPISQNLNSEPQTPNYKFQNPRPKILNPCPKHRKSHNKPKKTSDPKLYTPDPDTLDHDFFKEQI